MLNSLLISFFRFVKGIFFRFRGFVPETGLGSSHRSPVLPGPRCPETTHLHGLASRSLQLPGQDSDRRRTSPPKDLVVLLSTGV